jgi:hypothetical protein
LKSSEEPFGKTETRGKKPEKTGEKSKQTEKPEEEKQRKTLPC